MKLSAVIAAGADLLSALMLAGALSASVLLALSARDCAPPRRDLRDLPSPPALHREMTAPSAVGIEV